MTLSQSPAVADFQRDTRRTLGIIKVYEDCLGELDFVEVRAIKIWARADYLAMAREGVIGALNALVEWGYLIEHERGERNGRNFTLAWSVHPDRRFQRANPPSTLRT